MRGVARVVGRSWVRAARRRMLLNVCILEVVWSTMLRCCISKRRNKTT
jgi:hypothetical protein